MVWFHVLISRVQSEVTGHVMIKSSNNLAEDIESRCERTCVTTSMIIIIDQRVIGMNDPKLTPPWSLVPINNDSPSHALTLSME